MTDKVVDASAAAAILFDELAREVVQPRLKGVALHAPYLLQSELANVCVKKMRSDPDSADRYSLALAMIDGMNIQLHEIEPRDVAALARGLNLSAYDASYLWLARELGAELVTLDQRLGRASAGT